MIFIPHFYKKHIFSLHFFILYPLERPAPTTKNNPRTASSTTGQDLALNKPTFLKKGFFARSTQLLIIFIMLIKTSKKQLFPKHIMYIRFFCFT